MRGCERFGMGPMRGGRAAGLDLCVHIVRKDFGAEVANEVARRLVIPAHREGGQAQFIPSPVLAEGDPLAGLCARMRAHLNRDLTIAKLAGRARMSRRTFIRRFEETTGASPGEWVLQERVMRARSLPEATRHVGRRRRQRGWFRDSGRAAASFSHAFRHQPLALSVGVRG
jgi:transcriptional regulator GlxA family with amidase domain